MSTEDSKEQELRLEDLKPFRLHSDSQLYRGERLESFKSSIEKGLGQAIVVRPIDGGKYEIISGHNRVQAMKELGRNTIRADIRSGLSDDEAVALFYETNLNQQSFNDWNYTQKIKAIQYLIKQIEENKQQGKRNDLAEKATTEEGEGTCVQSRHKSDGSPKRRPATRDRMTRRLGIATATFSKYKAIATLPKEQMESIVRLLDERRITLEVAHTMTKLADPNLEWLVEELNQSTDSKVDLKKLKSSKSLMKCKKGEERTPEHSREQVKGLLIPKNPIKEEPQKEPQKESKSKGIPVVHGTYG